MTRSSITVRFGRSGTVTNDAWTKAIDPTKTGTVKVASLGRVELTGLTLRSIELVPDPPWGAGFESPSNRLESCHLLHCRGAKAAYHGSFDACRFEDLRSRSSTFRGRFAGCEWLKSGLSRSVWRARLDGCHATEVVLDEARFEDCLFDRSNFAACSFRRASFERCTFRACAFPECDLSEAMLVGCHFEDTAMSPWVRSYAAWLVRSWGTRRKLLRGSGTFEVELCARRSGASGPYAKLGRIAIDLAVYDGAAFADRVAQSLRRLPTSERPAVVRVAGQDVGCMSVLGPDEVLLTFLAALEDERGA